jgi:hypothetical protein
MRLRYLRDGAARELGYLYYQRERESAELEQGRLDAALFKMDDLKHEIERLEMQLAEEKARNDAEASAERAEAAASAAAEADATGTSEPPGDAPPVEVS